MCCAFVFHQLETLGFRMSGFFAVVAAAKAAAPMGGAEIVAATSGSQFILRSVIEPCLS